MPMKNRLKKLEYYMPKVRKGPDLSALSVPELKELEGYAIKKENGESFTTAEVERINKIMSNTRKA